MTDRQQRIHWMLSHLADLLLVCLAIGVILHMGGVL